MSLVLRPFDYSSRSDLDLMAKWCNDPEIKHLSSVHRCDADYAKVVTVEEVAGWPTERKWSWMCLADGEPVGECSLLISPSHAITREPDTGWYGILLGEAHARGKGLGRRFFTLLESESRSLGIRQAELGVFSFNTPAIRMYEALGYTKIAEIPDFTWWSDKFWADYRYLKRFG